jgi:hypothetical protein
MLKISSSDYVRKMKEFNGRVVVTNMKGYINKYPLDVMYENRADAEKAREWIESRYIMVKLRN